VPRSAYLREQLLKIRVAVLVSFALQVQMIMAQLMLDNRLRLLDAVRFELMRTDLDIVTLRKIATAGRSQPRIKSSLVQERPVEIGQRHSFDPSLQLLIFHFSNPSPVLTEAASRRLPKLDLLEL